MATELGEMQFEILPTADAEEGVLFGIGCDISVDEDGFRPGAPEWYTEDSENPHNGATAFGRDHLIGPTWQWQMHVNRDQTGNAVESLRQITRAWRGRQVRDELGALCAVRYQLAGRVRRVFGRPRQFQYDPDNRILGGYMPIAAGFKCADALIYDDEESVVSMDLNPGGSEGGLIFPVVFPASSLPSGNHDTTAVVEGDEETYPVIVFEGPVTNPSLETVKWSLSLDMVLADGEQVIVDTRPWANTVLFNGDTSVAGALGKRQWLSDMKFEPGSHPVVFRGSSSTPGARCEVRWRNAYVSI